MDMNRVTKIIEKQRIPFAIFQAKSTLGFSPGANIDDITDEKIHAQFVQRLAEVRVVSILNKIKYLNLLCFYEQKSPSENYDL